MAHAAGHPPSPPPHTDGAAATARQTVWRRRLVVLWRFGRPHTVVGTSLSVVGLYAMLLGAQQNLPRAEHLPWLILAWLSAVSANVFIVGLNQLTDVAIDRVNKPGLPIPAGELRFTTARWLVLGAWALSTLAGRAVAQVLLATVTASMLVGVAYSLPPLRLKRFAGWAALSIALVRGPLVNVGVYAALATRLFDQSWRVVPAQVWALAGFIAVFSLGIAVAKDISDVAGDRRFAVGSLAVRAGPALAFNVARALIGAAYVAVIALGVLGLPGANAAALVLGHASLLAALWLGTARTRPADAQSMAAAYALIWRLFYAEYIVFPLACVLA